MPAIYFATIPEPGRPLFQPEFALVQRKAVIVDGVQTEPARVVYAVTDAFGIIPIPEGPDQKAALAAMEAVRKNTRYNGPTRILGPFESIDAATKAQHAARTKTDPEVIAELSSVNSTAAKENSELKAKLAALEAQVGKEKK